MKSLGIKEPEEKPAGFYSNENQEQLMRSYERYMETLNTDFDEAMDRQFNTALESNGNIIHTPYHINQEIERQLYRVSVAVTDEEPDINQSNNEDNENVQSVQTSDGTTAYPF